MKKKRNTKSGSKITDFIIIIVGLIGIALSLYFFKNLLYKSLARENDVAVGTITFKRKSPRRKLQHESVWEYLKVQSVIYQGDYILTEDLSEAQLFFNDDNYSVEDQIGNVSHVYYNENEREQIKTGMAQIHANSMMRVGEDHLLHFISGSVSLSSGINSDDLSIQVGENIYTLDKNTKAVFSMLPRTEINAKQTATIFVSQGRLFEEKAPVLQQKGLKKVSVKSSEAPVEIVAGQIKSVQVVSEEFEKEKTVRNVSSDIKEKISSKGESTKKYLKNTIQKIAPDIQLPSFFDDKSEIAETEKNVVSGSKNSVKNNSKTTAGFNVLMPPSTYSIAQNEELQESIPFYWTNTKSIKIEFSYNQNFSSIVAVESLENENQKGAVFLGFAKPDDILYWRAMPSYQNYSEKIEYPSGRIVVNNPKENNLENALKTVYGNEYKSEIEEVLKETQKVQGNNQKQLEKELAPVRVQENKSAMPVEQKSELSEQQESELNKNELTQYKDLHSGKTDEELRIQEEKKAEEERKKALQKKAQEEKRKAQEAAKKAEAEKKAQAAKKAEAEKKAAAARKAEEEKRAAAAAAEEKRLQEAKKAAEAEQAKKLEEARKALETKKQQDKLEKEKLYQSEGLLNFSESENVQESKNNTVLEQSSFTVNEKSSVIAKEENQKQENSVKEEMEKASVQETEGESEPENEEVDLSDKEIKKQREAFEKIEIQLSKPVNQKTFKEEDFESLFPKIDFEWQKVQNATKYILQIYDSKNDVLIEETVKNNKFTLSGNNLSKISDDGEYSWCVTAVSKIGKEEVKSKTASSTFFVQIEDAEAAEINIDNLITVQ